MVQRHPSAKSVGETTSRGISTTNFPTKYDDILYNPEFSSLKKTSLSIGTSDLIFTKNFSIT